MIATPIPHKLARVTKRKAPAHVIFGVTTVQRTLAANDTKWLSLFHIVGQSGVPIALAEGVVNSSPLFKTKYTQDGVLWVRLT